VKRKTAAEVWGVKRLRASHAILNRLFYELNDSKERSKFKNELWALACLLDASRYAIPEIMISQRVADALAKGDAKLARRLNALDEKVGPRPNPITRRPA
jgi:hypothetical protein